MKLGKCSANSATATAPDRRRVRRIYWIDRLDGQAAAIGADDLESGLLAELGTLDLIRAVHVSKAKSRKGRRC